MPADALYYPLELPFPEVELIAVPALKDNYAYLLHQNETGFTFVVDPSVAEPVLAALDAKGWTLDLILNTHHHPDHVGGNNQLVRRTGALVAGYIGDRDRIPAIAVPLEDGEIFACGAYEAEILFIPGHTLGHIAYHFPTLKLVFTGDTLFSLGCGRLFEGTPEQMLSSLKRLAALPPDTRICCGHEYTNNNARFALTLEPENYALMLKSEQVAQLRLNHLPTLPALLSDELACNPFLRCGEAVYRQYGEDELAVFTAIRRMKDLF